MPTGKEGARALRVFVVGVAAAALAACTAVLGVTDFSPGVDAGAATVDAAKVDASRPHDATLDRTVPRDAVHDAGAEDAPGPCSSGCVVLFGGYGFADSGAPEYLGDTWTWNGATWTSHASRGASPSPRQSAAMGWVDGGAVLFGGIATDAAVDLGDTWFWDGASWSEVDDGGTQGALVRFPVLARVGGDLVLLGLGSNGDTDMVTAVWNGRGWTVRDASADVPGRLRFAMAGYGDGVVMFGGLAVPSFDAALGDTWTWDGGASWVESSEGGDAAPPARYYASAASFGVAGGAPGVLLFGGLHTPPNVHTDGGLLSDSWTWNGSRWAHVGVGAGDSAAPPARNLPGMATAAAGSGVVLFGGSDVRGKAFGDTWTYAPATGWRRASPPRSPPSRWAVGMAGRP